MDIGKAIFARLNGTPEVTALVESRIFPLESQTSRVYPLVTYSTVDETEECIDGTTRLRKFTVTLAITGMSYVLARQLAGVVRAALHRQAGQWGGLVVRACSCLNDSEQDGALLSNSELLYYTVDQTYVVFAFDPLA